MKSLTEILAELRSNGLAGDPLCIACDPETEIPLAMTAIRMYFRYGKERDLDYWIEFAKGKPEIAEQLLLELAEKYKRGEQL